jgi:hypothetical protein
MNRQRLLRWTVLACAVAAMSGCVVVPAHRYYYPYHATVVVPVR